MNFLKRLTVCILTICLSFSLISCGNIGRPVLEKIDEISSGLGISLPGGSSAGSGKADDAEDPDIEDESEKKDPDDKTEETDSDSMTEAPEAAEIKASTGLVPSVPAYDPGADMANVINRDQFSYDQFSAEAKDFLARNHFFVEQQRPASGNPEFYELYEENRYWHIPNFVTVDSLMHTYHLYFTVLMRTVEREHLAPALTSLSRGMLQKSLAQYEALKGTPWEGAAFRNAVFFSVGLNLQETAPAEDAAIRQVVEEELGKIYNAAGPAPCALFGASDSFYSGTHDEDYSQYRPRGNYEGDPILEAYFRAMMWYGRISFLAEDEDATRSALLITAAMDGSGGSGLALRLLRLRSAGR